MEASIAKTLQAPFEPEEIEWRLGSTNAEKTQGLALAYVTNRAIQNRLDDLFGPFGWQNEFREWRGNSQICGISVRDPATGEWITKWDGADDSQVDAVKGGLSDSMKRAGYQWGIGRYLYNLPDQWVPIEPAGKAGNRIKRGFVPSLPAWALPEGHKPAQKQNHSDAFPNNAKTSECPEQGNASLLRPTVAALFAVAKSKGYEPLDVARYCNEKCNASPEKLSTDQLQTMIDAYTRCNVRGQQKAAG